MVCSKELCLAEQNLCELEAEENMGAKTGSNPTVVETVHTLVVEFLSPAVYLSPLADPFFFNSSFFQLPDLLSFNTPQLSLLHF